MYKNSQRAAQSDLDIRSCFHSALCGFWLCPGCLELERRMCWLICCYLGCHGTIESIECGCARAGHSGHHWCQVSGARPRHCQLSVPLLSAPAADRCNNLPNHEVDSMDTGMGCVVYSLSAESVMSAITVCC